MVGVMIVPSPLQDKSKAFALEIIRVCIIRVCNEIKREKREGVLTNQLIRSGTSVGANIREASMPTARLILLQNCRLP